MKVRNQLFGLIRGVEIVDRVSADLGYGNLSKALRLEPLGTSLPAHTKSTLNVLNARLFVLYLTLLGSAGDAEDLIIHPHFKVFFLWDRQHFPCFNAIKLRQRWIHSYTLMYNIFYNQTAFLIFSHKALQKEAYSVS